MYGLRLGLRSANDLVSVMHAEGRKVFMGPWISRNSFRKHVEGDLDGI